MPSMSPPVAKNKASATRNELKTLSGILAEGIEMWGRGLGEGDNLCWIIRDIRK